MNLKEAKPAAKLNDSQQNPEISQRYPNDRRSQYSTSCQDLKNQTENLSASCQDLINQSENLFTSCQDLLNQSEKSVVVKRRVRRAPVTKGALKQGLSQALTEIPGCFQREGTKDPCDDAGWWMSHHPRVRAILELVIGKCDGHQVTRAWPSPSRAS